MKHLVSLFLGLLCAVSLYAQPTARQFSYVNVDPAGACTNGTANRYNYVLGKEWGCKAGVWTTLATSGATPPAGPANSIQFNNGGAFGGNSGLYFDATLGFVATFEGGGLYLPVTDTGDIPTFGGATPITVNTATGSRGNDVYINPSPGGATTVVTDGIGGDAGSINLRPANGGTAANANTSSTGGTGSNIFAYGGTGGVASGTGTNIAGSGGTIFLTAGQGGDATNGTSNIGGDAGYIVVQLSNGGSGSTANGADSNFRINSARLGAVALEVTSAGKVSIFDLKTTGSATGKKVVCVDTTTGILYASSTGTDCSN